MILGVIGCGAIGSRVVQEAEGIAVIDAILVNDRHIERAEAMSGGKTRVATFEEILENCSLVLESAAPSAVPELVPRILDNGIDVIIMSSGALLDRELLKDIERRASNTGTVVHIPSGAICGIDALRAAAVGEVERLVITTYKRPGSIRPSDKFVDEKGIDLSAIRESTLIFEGTPAEGILYFPRNVNVSATVRLAVGPNIEMLLRVFADPDIERNRHEIAVSGEFGSLTLALNNLPSENPGTSELAVLSAVGTLRQILSRVKVGY